MRQKNTDNVSKAKALYKQITGKQLDGVEEADEIFMKLLDFYDTIIAQMPGSVYWKDKHGRYLGCNNTAAKLAGLTRNELCGMTDYDLIESLNWSKDTANSFAADDKQVFKGKTLENRVEELWMASNNKRIIQMTNKLPIYDKEKNVLAVLGISLDITKEKEYEQELKIALEKAQAADKAKDSFLASCAHELRTPVANMKGLLDEFQDDLDDPFLTQQEKYDHMETLMDQIDQMSHLVEDVLDTTKGVDQIKVNIAPFSLRKVVSLVYRAKRASKKRAEGVGVECIYPEDLPDNVLADEYRVRQAIQNLMNNAEKFTEAGSITLFVERDPDQLNHLRICVKDTGIGIAEEKLPLVWNKLTQVHSEHDDKRMGRYRGLGLGLSIVQLFVEAMDGSVGVESKLGEGSTFYFTIPLAEAHSN